MTKKQGILLVLGILVIGGNQKTFSLVILDPAYTAESYISVPGGLGLGWANHMTFDPDGNLYITFRGTSTSVQDGVIYRFKPDKTGEIFATGFYTPENIIWTGGTDYGEYLYVADPGTYVSGSHYGDIQRVYSDGSTSLFSTPWNRPVSLGLDRTGNYGGYMYTGASGLDHIDRVLPDGSIQHFSDYPYNISGNPKNIAFDPGNRYDGQMYVGTYSSSNSTWAGVFSLDINGNPTRFSDDIASGLWLEFDTAGQFFGGDLFVNGSEELGGIRKIYRVASDGSATAFADDDPFSVGQFTFGPDGAMYILQDYGGYLGVVRVTPEPGSIIIRSINEALEFKHQALDKIEQALEKEQAAIQTLHHLKDNLGPVAIAKAKMRIKISMIFERIAKHRIRKSMASMKTALSILTGSDHTPDPPNEKEMELLEEEEIRRSDINQDGIVNTLDYAILMKHWLKENK